MASNTKNRNTNDRNTKGRNTKGRNTKDCGSVDSDAAERDTADRSVTDCKIGDRKAKAPVHSKKNAKGPLAFEIKSKAQFYEFYQITKSRLFAGERVEQLKISGEAEWRATQAECMLLRGALMKMPRLKTLKLETGGLHLPIIIATLYTHATALEDLHIKMDDLGDPYDPTDLLILRILMGGVGKLRSVHFLGPAPNERRPQTGQIYPQEYVDGVALLLGRSAHTIQQLHIHALQPTQIFARTRHPLRFPNLESLIMYGAHFDTSPCFTQVHQNLKFLELSVRDSDSGQGGFLFNIPLLERFGQYFPSLVVLKLIAQSEDGPDLLGLDQLFEFFLKRLKGLERIVLSLETRVDGTFLPCEGDFSGMEFNAINQWGMRLPALNYVAFIPRSRRANVRSWTRANKFSRWTKFVKKTPAA